jgi:hypothetical protein
MRIAFNEVHIFATRRGKCAVCGKSCQRRRKFWQTLNPFNRNADGFPKDRDEIMQELRQQAKDWQEEPLYHANCED